MIKYSLTIALATLGVLFLITGIGNWTNALDTEFIAYGQTGGGGGGGGEEPGDTVTNIVPQIAVGSYDGGATDYTTTIQIINGNSDAVTLSSADFFNTDGTDSTVSFTTDNDTVPSFTGSLSDFMIPANDSLLLTGAGSDAGVVNWGRIITDSAVAVSTIFEIRQTDSRNNISRVGVPSSDSDIQTLLIPRLRNADNGVSTAFAIVNTGDAAVTIDVTLYRGGAVVGSGVLNLEARSHSAQFAREFFSESDEISDRSFSHMVFSSDVATIAATALVFEGGNQATFPIVRID